MICPSCSGRRQVGAFVTRRDGCGPQITNCSTCRGTGEVSNDHGQCVDLGRHLREERHNLELTLGNAARALGMKASELSDAELGRAPANQIIELTAKLTKKSKRHEAEMAKKIDYDKTHPLPESHGATMQKDMPQNVMRAAGYNVGSWCPTPDGSGKATEVHFGIELDLGDEKPNPTVVLRFKSAGELRRCIGMLARHLADVWPEAME